MAPASSMRPRGTSVISLRRYANARVRHDRAGIPHHVGAFADSRVTPTTKSVERQPPREVRTMDTYLQQVEQAAKTQVTKMRWWLGLNGILSIALGVVIVVWPDISLYSLVIVFGAYALVRGIFGVATALSGPKYDGRGWLILSSLASIVFGVIVFADTGMSAL